MNIGNPTPISTRSGLIPAIALDLDQTVFSVSPGMREAEKRAIERGSGVKGSWSDWERLAVRLDEVEPNEEMIKFAQRLQGSGISINVMTARSERIQEPTMRLLEKVGIVPNEVFFRPDTFEGDTMPSSILKVNWMKQSSDTFNYIGIFDDSPSNVKAAYKYGVPAILQPNADATDARFIEGALTRGLKTMEELAVEGKIASQQMQRGVSTLETMMEIGTRSGKSQPRTFTSIIKGKEIAENIIKGIL